MDVSPRQLVSVASAMIPFQKMMMLVEHLWGSNMQRQQFHY